MLFFPSPPTLIHLAKYNNTEHQLSARLAVEGTVMNKADILNRTNSKHVDATKCKESDHKRNTKCFKTVQRHIKLGWGLSVGFLEKMTF
jgi:hypothetical protein